MTGSFPDILKKTNVLPIHKKESRQVKKNYRPISLLPICGKIFEKVMFDVLYKHLSDNQILTTNQSGFRPGDSTIINFYTSPIVSMRLSRSSHRVRHVQSFLKHIKGI